jgi:hypothetical protein
MKKIFVVVLILMVLTACQPSEEAIQKAIAETEAARPTETQIPPTEMPENTATNTKVPTSTKIPTSTILPTIEPTSTVSPQDITNTLLDGVEILVLEMAEDDVDSFNLKRMNENVMEIELKTRWASKNSQPDVSYIVVRWISFFANALLDPDSNFKEIYPDGFDLSLTTYSVNGDYKYSSFSNFDTLLKVYNKSISYNEWVQLSSAGFK